MPQCIACSCLPHNVLVTCTFITNQTRVVHVQANQTHNSCNISNYYIFSHTHTYNVYKSWRCPFPQTNPWILPTLSGFTWGLLWQPTQVRGGDGLLITKGFHDLLHIGNQSRPYIFYLVCCQVTLCACRTDPNS